MINITRKLIKIISPKLYVCISLKKNYFLDKNLISKNPKPLIFVHIGKCGGTTLNNILNNSSKIKSMFSLVYRIHLKKPPIIKHASYVIVCRNPIQRAISAFNWSYKLVVTDKAQGVLFEGEYDVLKKYKTFNNLCEQLYIDGALNYTASKDFQTIHHLRENMTFYLKPLLDKISPSQLFAVFAAETLNQDVVNILNISVRNNSNLNLEVSPNKKFLSKKAYSNLKTYLADDYRYLSKLISMSTTSSVDKEILLK